jgi:hypothetical protein
MFLNLCEQARWQQTLEAMESAAQGKVLDRC